MNRCCQRRVVQPEGDHAGIRVRARSPRGSLRPAGRSCAGAGPCRRAGAPRGRPRTHRTRAGQPSAAALPNSFKNIFHSLRRSLSPRPLRIRALWSFALRRRHAGAATGTKRAFVAGEVSGFPHREADMGVGGDIYSETATNCTNYRHKMSRKNPLTCP